MLGVLGIVFAGSILAGLAPSLAVLIVGRVLQGVGLGLTPITMAAARDHLPRDRSPQVIGVLSVTAAAGIGAGYPISGLISDQLGLHAAYLFGAVMSALGAVAVFTTVPPSTSTSRVTLDIRGAVIIAAGVTALLLGIAEGEAWGWTSAATLGLFAAAAMILAVWARLQLITPMPLVDLRQLRRRAVLAGDIAGFILGTALYLFLSLITEFVQAPHGAGYGFAATTLVAGLCLVPFSVASLAVSRTTDAAVRRHGPRIVLAGGALSIAASGAFLALEHGALWEAFVALGVLGVGFGYTYAAIPGLITRAVPDAETGSAMGFYQVLRSIGFSIGSALGATILAGSVTRGGLPTEHGYVTALWIGAGICVASAVAVFVLAPPGAAALSPRVERLVHEDAELAAAGLGGGEREP